MLNSVRRLLLLSLACALCVVSLAQSGTSPARADERTTIGGVYELGIGTTNPQWHIAYWTNFGYTVGKEGDLSEAESKKLYGVASKVHSIRLVHQDADHGLIRLLVWEKPTGNGLELSPMKVVGNRWGAMMTDDMYNLENHVEDALAAGSPIYHVPPQKAVIYKTDKPKKPFFEQSPCVREMCLIQSETRQIMFQRFGYSLPLYGKVNEQSLFKSSQITHFGMVTQTGKEELAFYDGVLGLLRVRDDQKSEYTNASSKSIFELNPGESYVTTDFDDPRSSTDPQKSRSGRLKIIRFPANLKIANKMTMSNPGNLGPSLYTFRVTGIDEYHRRVKQSKATNVTDIMRNEFGERSFSFVAPDGYFWTLVE